MDYDDTYSDVPERATRIYARPAYIGSASPKSLDVSPLPQKLPTASRITHKTSGYHIDVDFKIGELAIFLVFAVQS
jgi:hypothetical protein